MANITPRTLTGYPATQSMSLAPVIGIDPGARWIGVAARIGDRCVRATTVHNPATARPGGHPDVIPVHRHRPGHLGGLIDEDAIPAILDAVGGILADPVLDAEARAWWASIGSPVADGETPWVIAVELTVEPRLTPEGQREKNGRRYKVGVREAGDYGATNAVAATIGTALDPVVWIAPRGADDRHRLGTRRREDYWPDNLLNAGDPRVTGMPDTGSIYDTDPFVHVRAAYSIATDAGRVLLEQQPGRTPAQVTPPDKRLLRLTQLRGWAVVGETPAQRAQMLTPPPTPPLAAA